MSNWFAIRTLFSFECGPVNSADILIADEPNSLIESDLCFCLLSHIWSLRFPDLASQFKAIKFITTH